MKHESIVVVYDSCQAIAEEIADKLGAETVSVQSLNNRQIKTARVLSLPLSSRATVRFHHIGSMPVKCYVVPV